MAAFPAPQLNDRQDRNGRYLAWLAATIAEVPLTAQEWPGLPGGERAGSPPSGTITWAWPRR